MYFWLPENWSSLENHRYIADNTADFTSQSLICVEEMPVIFVFRKIRL